MLVLIYASIFLSNSIPLGLIYISIKAVRHTLETERFRADVYHF